MFHVAVTGLHAYLEQKMCEKYVEKQVKSLGREPCISKFFKLDVILVNILSMYRLFFEYRPHSSKKNRYTHAIAYTDSEIKRGNGTEFCFRLVLPCRHVWKSSHGNNNCQRMVFV